VVLKNNEFNYNGELILNPIYYKQSYLKDNNDNPFKKVFLEK